MKRLRAIGFWPFVSDRNAIKVESPQEMAEVVRQVNRALGYVARPAAPDASIAAYRASSRWVMLLLAALSALVGALVTWFVK